MFSKLPVIEEINILDILANKLALSISKGLNNSHHFYKQKQYMATLPNLNRSLKQLKIGQ